MGTQGYPIPCESKPTTLKEITGNVELLTSRHTEKASSKWDFRVQCIAAPEQFVWFMEDNRAISRKVTCVRVHLVEPKSKVKLGFEHKVEYSLTDTDGDQTWVNEEHVFATKADLLASL